VKKRCGWAPLDDELYIEYHDVEWGVPVHDDRILFEMLILEGAQAGLSWSTILKKRENYRLAFDNWNFEKIAKYGEIDEKRLLENVGIIRNKLKIKSASRNARVFIEIGKEFGSFDEYLWGFVKGEQIKNEFESIGEPPTTTELSDKISADLKKRDMNFVGSKIIYAYLQAVGIIKGHEIGCFRHREI
jgi:DNA-3-methyladenine glycosylase I